MEMNRRRSSRGFMIAKLIPFCKSGKPLTPSQDFYNNVHSYTSSTMTSYAHRPDISNYVTTTTPLPPKVSFLLQPSLAHEGKDMEKKLNTMAEKLIGRGMNGVEECVDARAASYISSVRERFKLDHCERRLTTVISLDEED
ncbi:hypothetical protein CARUB_v10014878mg [Capsella rubella]|uniref:Uncharacterized protein n=1 Tax=Capsella rubella TaxID=81985 RepID=R0HPH9_9BRAS|nr:uncharacterized protein LOC17893358 [Capsella rubella]EOA31673.1 hypothetical protein CARUB_v10014878mg [Capsella rubella]EOA31674.1 hypothetical protein CARUB_v10014878mg [Capsella rubella]